MKEIIGVQFSPWDRAYYFDPRDVSFKNGDYAVVKTNLGIELGRVVETKKMEDEELAKMESEGEDAKIKPIMRKANISDLKKMEDKQGLRSEALNVCRDYAKRHNLPMKLIDARFSFDGGRVVFAFIAKERIDFRKLVEELTRHFQKSIRMQQIGVRGEAKIFGDTGLCGRRLCCHKLLKNPGNVTLELVHDQQVAHRGIERLSGVCGRLMCCLAYEEDFYKELIKNMPPIGSFMKVKKGKGEVIGWHVMKQTVRVRLEDGAIMEVPI